MLGFRALIPIASIQYEKEDDRIDRPLFIIY